MRRHLLFAVFCAFFIVIAVAYIVRARANSSPSPVPTGAVADSIAVLPTRPGLMFIRADFNNTNRAIALAPLGAADERFTAALRCDRVHFAGSAGVCLTSDRGVVTTYSAHTFGSDFRVRHTVPLSGAPSRTRVSPDGRRAAMTVFVSGDSYNAAGFSTRTTLLDVETGGIIADLEEFTVVRSGSTFKAVDFNFWGVTFAQDSNRFFATLRTGGTNYLVEGDINQRSMRVVRSDIECPSLSPDNRRITYKKRVSASGWRVHLLDLRTMRDRALGESRPFDDQAEWIDDTTIAYALPTLASGATGGSDVWALTVDGDAAPRLVAARAHSPAIIR